jgi:hypothetical protein
MEPGGLASASVIVIVDACGDYSRSDACCMHDVLRVARATRLSRQMQQARAKEGMYVRTYVCCTPYGVLYVQ